MKEMIQLIGGMSTGQLLRIESGVANLARKVTFCFRMGTSLQNLRSVVIQGGGKQWPCCACQAALAGSPALLSPGLLPGSGQQNLATNVSPPLQTPADEPEMH